MITLEKMMRIAAMKGNVPCIVDSHHYYSWDYIIACTESGIAFLKSKYSDSQLRSASYLSKNSVDIICWLAAFSTPGISVNGIDYSLPIDILVKNEQNRLFLIKKFYLFKVKAMKESYGKGVLCCLLATLAWGGMFPVMTHALNYMDAFNFTTLRYAMAGVAFAVLLFLREGRGGFRLAGERWGLAWLLGSLGFAGFGFLVFLGQHLAGASGALSASIMMATMPMLGLLAVWALKKTRPPLSTFGFILLSFFGVLLVLTKGDAMAVLSSPVNRLADLLLITGALCWVLYTIGGSYFPRWSPLRYTTMTTLLGMITVAVVDGVLNMSGTVVLPSVTVIWAVFPHLLYMALVAGFIAVLCWNVGNKLITAGNGVLFMDVVPVTVFSVSAWYGVVPNGVQLIGAVITASALVLNNLNQRKRALAKIRLEKECGG